MKKPVFLMFMCIFSLALTDSGMANEIDLESFGDEREVRTKRFVKVHAGDPFQADKDCESARDVINALRFKKYDVKASCTLGHGIRDAILRVGVEKL